jgi:PAS domain S-box-containing protein
VAALLAATASDLNQELEHGIEQRTGELRNSEERFRQLTESISEVFWMTDPSKTQMLYISPAYEQIWGRSCASLYDAPTSWMDSIHPDDRERISQRAMTNQASKKYDEEYRILRPGGSIRWIRDRAFPITDDTGAVYRIAGIAEDITEREQAETQIFRIVSSLLIRPFRKFMATPKRRFWVKRPRFYTRLVIHRRCLQKCSNKLASAVGGERCLIDGKTGPSFRFTSALHWSKTGPAGLLGCWE